MSDSPRNPYEDDIVISWPELHRDARYLSEVLHSIKPWKGIIAVTRGGLVPAALIARELDIRLIDTVCVVSYSASGGAAEQIQGSLQILKGVSGDGDGFLLVDDLWTPEKPREWSAPCCRRPTSRRFTQNQQAGRLLIPL